MIYDFICIGYGVATASFILTLTAVENTGMKVLVLDDAFDGGELRRNYGQVRSNTTWSQFIDAVAKYCSPVKLAALKSAHGLQDTTTLDELIYQLNGVVQAALANSSIKLHKRCERVDEISYQDRWIVCGYEAKTIIVCPGAKPKHLHLPKPTLQLSSVLNRSNLPCRPGEHIVVFGTAHSGTLAIKSLIDAGTRVSAIYHGSKPFKYARDGEYDGIKQESAIIADSLPESVKLINNSDESAVRAELLDCDWVLYACGFSANNNIKVKVNGNYCENGLTNYDPITGKLLSIPSAFGFGIAYPNSNIVNGKTYYDVSAPAFIKHIEKNINVVLGSLAIKENN